MSLSFSVPTHVLAGRGSSMELAHQIRGCGGGAVALVVDAGMYRAGLLDEIQNLIETSNGISLASVSFSEVDPSVQVAEQEAEAAIAAGAGVVVGIGGGSALSLAKAVAIRLRNPGPISTYAGVGLAPNRPAPFIAIPTTAGSGSEVSNALVLYDTESNHNIGMRGIGYEPDIAVLDGELLVGLPLEPMREAAADALSHAFEALWACGATRFTNTLALEAARVIGRVLPRALGDRNPEDLQALLEASTMANFGCGNAGLGLVHALSSATAIRIPHGRQNSVLLPIVAEFNRSVVGPEVAAEIDALDDLYAEAGLPRSFRPGELDDGGAEAMAAAAKHSPFRANNRRDSTDEDLLQLATAAAIESLSTDSRSLV